MSKQVPRSVLRAVSRCTLPQLIFLGYRVKCRWAGNPLWRCNKCGEWMQRSEGETCDCEIIADMTLDEYLQYLANKGELEMTEDMEADLRFMNRDDLVTKYGAWR
jgi:hypothetical protein